MCLCAEPPAGVPPNGAARAPATSPCRGACAPSGGIAAPASWGPAACRPVLPPGASPAPAPGPWCLRVCCVSSVPEHAAPGRRLRNSPPTAPHLVFRPSTTHCLASTSSPQPGAHSTTAPLPLGPCPALLPPLLLLASSRLPAAAARSLCQCRYSIQLVDAAQMNSCRASGYGATPPAGWWLCCCCCCCSCCCCCCWV